MISHRPVQPHQFWKSPHWGNQIPFAGFIEIVAAISDSKLDLPLAAHRVRCTAMRYRCSTHYSATATLKRSLVVLAALYKRTV